VEGTPISTAAPTTTLRPGVRGRVYPPSEFEVTARTVSSWARVCRAEAAYERWAPIAFAEVALLEAALRPLVDPDLGDLVRLARVLCKDSVAFEGAAPPVGARLRAVAEVADVWRDDAGVERLRVRVTADGPAGPLVGTWVWRVGGAAVTASGLAAVDRVGAPFPVEPGLPGQYAKTSRDRDPVSTDAGFARLSGHPDVVLPAGALVGLASARLLGHADDPRPLAALGAHVGTPAYPGDRLEVRAGAGRFEIVNQSGVAVLADGWYRMT
jgi:hypothetical protein